MLTIGFSTGDLHEIYSKRREQEFSLEYINILRSVGFANAIELHCSDEASLNHLLNHEFDFSRFIFVSLHAPDIKYDEKAIKKMLSLSRKYKIANFVFHADKSLNWNLLSKSDLPISIENMDDRKEFGKTVKEVGSILEKYNFDLTLDLQHCFVNDPSMRLATEFQKEFEDRITEYHISGYDKVRNHSPLFKASQNKIITSLSRKDKPIIIESTFSKLMELEKEIEYIRDKISL